MVAQFAYEARTEEGELTAGMLAAESVEEAGRLLSERGLFVIRMSGEKARERTDERARTRGRATRAQVVWQISQLAVMVETGIRISEALDCLARQAADPQLKLLLEDVSRHVQEGRSLSEAMAFHPRSFPPTLTALIEASEMSGTMSRVLRRCADYLLNELKVIKRIRGAVMYPLFMFVLCIAVTVFLLTVILPRFEAVFASRGATLPLPTRVLMALSESLMGAWYFWALGLILAIIVPWLWFRTDAGGRMRDTLVLRLPVLGGVFHKLYQSRTFSTMALLLDSGVPLVETMRIVRQVTPNLHYRRLWQEVDDRIQRGEPMAGPLLASPLIPESIAQMIDSGDRSGRLGMVFSHLADFTEEEYNQAIETATRFIEPAMVLFMGAMVGFIAAALMLPLFQAGQIISQ